MNSASQQLDAQQIDFLTQAAPIWPEIPSTLIDSVHQDVAQVTNHRRVSGVTCSQNPQIDNLRGKTSTPPSSCPMSGSLYDNPSLTRLVFVSGGEINVKKEPEGAISSTEKFVLNRRVDAGTQTIQQRPKTRALEPFRLKPESPDSISDSTSTRSSSGTTPSQDTPAAILPLTQTAPTAIVEARSIPENIPPAIKTEIPPLVSPPEETAAIPEVAAPPVRVELFPSVSPPRGTTATQSRPNTSKAAKAKTISKPAAKTPSKKSNNQKKPQSTPKGKSQASSKKKAAQKKKAKPPKAQPPRIDSKTEAKLEQLRLLQEKRAALTRPAIYENVVVPAVKLPLKQELCGGIPLAITGPGHTVFGMAPPGTTQKILIKTPCEIPQTPPPPKLSKKQLKKRRKQARKAAKNEDLMARYRAEAELQQRSAVKILPAPRDMRFNR